jgi:predicted branched-subunit amino acid permease
MKETKSLRFIGAIVLALIGAAVVAHSVSLLEDCSGALCGMIVIFHTLPLAFSWLLMLIAFFVSFRKSVAFWLVMPISVVANLVIIKMVSGYGDSGDYLPSCFLLLVIQALVTGFYVTNKPGCEIRQQGK